MKVNRVVNVTKGGRRQSYNALVVIGNRRGSAGFGFGKGLQPENALAIAFRDAERNVVFVDMENKRTVNQELRYKYRSTRVIIRPQAPGGPLTCGRPYLPVLEAFGFREGSIKLHGSRNMLNAIKAIWNALARHQSVEDVQRARGRTMINVSRNVPDLRRARRGPAQGADVFFE